MIKHAVFGIAIKARGGHSVARASCLEKKPSGSCVTENSILKDSVKKRGSYLPETDVLRFHARK